MTQDCQLLGHALLQSAKHRSHPMFTAVLPFDCWRFSTSVSQPFGTRPKLRGLVTAHRVLLPSQATTVSELILRMRYGCRTPERMKVSVFWGMKLRN
jgi:hypothetical protein